MVFVPTLVLVPIDFSYMTSYRLSVGPSNLILLKDESFDDDGRRRTQHHCSISAIVSTVG